MKAICKALCLVGLVAGGTTSAVAGTTYFENPQAYGMRQYLDDQLYRFNGSLKSRCLAEERVGRLTTTCQQYKHDLNRLVRDQMRREAGA
ncbi:hypothetical protein [Sphingomonas sp. MA1305]|uniref:hypothetical protein n=1 Tax=Sphingomonas sp. MA1305 TaxID=2479204 RepID=UPI0018DF63C8|nr:hypothetical protein [Sphingomonas sp. MA1305]